MSVVAVVLSGVAVLAQIGWAVSSRTTLGLYFNGLVIIIVSDILSWRAYILGDFMLGIGARVLLWIAHQIVSLGSN